MVLETFVGAAVDFIINKVSESGTPMKSIIVGFIIISLLSTAKWLFGYVYRNFNPIVRKMQGKHRIDSLKEEAQQVRQKIIRARQSLKSYSAYFDSEVEQATGVVKMLRIVPGFQNKHNQAIEKVTTLKEISKNQNIKIDDILAEMLANSNEAERWFEIREKEVSEAVKKHSPLKKGKKY